LDFVPVDSDLAFAAGEYRQRHYHRERLPLSYTDCFCIVLAQRLNAPIVTIEKPLRQAPDVTSLLPSEFVATL
jgi:PIN domain nuclease of toxin-antitoxin system